MSNEDRNRQGDFHPTSDGTLLNSQKTITQKPLKPSNTA